jgi:hypothetical protein
MANYKRKKPRRSVRCGLCSDARMGNKRGHTGRRARVGLSVSTKSQRCRSAELEGLD